MKEHLHLFTPVSEANLIDQVQYQFCSDMGRFYFGQYREKYDAFDLGGGCFHKSESVTHVLDLSALTTKERAIKAFKKSVFEAEDRSIRISQEYFEQEL